ncbi:MAG: alpha-glucan family phosphorylase [Sphingobacteriaceae bacterium]
MIVDTNSHPSVAYFSMEYAIDQALKIYSGGLGFLAGSHLRSAYDLGLNITAVGILWTYGYYDQQRDENGRMASRFVAKHYSFLEETGIQFQLTIHNSPVHVKVLKLKPETFGTAPLYLLTTDIKENDYLARTISHHLYDPDEAARIAQSILLGAGGAKLLELLTIEPDVYHLNEGHALPLLFHLYKKYKNLDEVKKKVVFTTHTPEKAGNEEHSFNLLEEMSFFSGVNIKEIREVLKNKGKVLNYTLTALQMSRKSNAVSKTHLEATKKIWHGTKEIETAISITNAQNQKYWADELLQTAFAENNDKEIILRKKQLKKTLFTVVADQCGKLFDEDVLTIVWARRFAEYKRADLLLQDWERFFRIISSTDFPVQVIWAGKPYPTDSGAINLFNRIASLTEPFPNCALLTGYELALSKLLKQGSDIWLNTPRMFREASGTSGMSAAMNGSINLSIPDGWIPEFAISGENCFIIPPAGSGGNTHENDKTEALNLYEMLEHSVIPMYYKSNAKWVKIMKQAAHDIVPYFDSDRMVREYYTLLYLQDE